MTKLKLSTLPDDKPVKLTVELPAAIHRDLVAYAEVLGGRLDRPLSPQSSWHRCWHDSCRQTEPSGECDEKAKDRLIPPNAIGLLAALAEARPASRFFASLAPAPGSRIAAALDYRYWIAIPH